ncbi:MFS transporter [Nonomuraea roseoviolacea subsp. roseoviolacea]|uniref:MFS family permease n=1 Tax=Nonomuraea roseoviolacea subsp. carminata TaxID=160689 RepID=A0ABT1K4F1_9ACTN|nr:MFS transporter [Nonomuraea roseoviolacea]MCP2348878.1 MFS family permease [Nonomuraea roseoviolacea subsp. carminata]
MGRSYWLLLTGFLASSLGTWIYRLALPLLVYDLTGSPLGTGLVYVMEYVPYLLLGMVGGVLADRYDRRRLLVVGDTASAVVTLVLAAMVALGVGRLWPIYLVALLLAAVDPLYQPAFRALVPALVPAERLPQANARVHIGEHAVGMAGPMAGGALVVAFGYHVAVYVDAGSFLLSALLIALIGGRFTATAARDRRRPEEGEPGPVTAGAGEGRARWPTAAGAEEGRARWSMAADLREGLRFLWRGDRAVLTTAIMSSACNFGVWLLLADLVYYLSSYHGFTPGEIGVVYAFQGAGAVAGALLGGWLVRVWPPGRIMTWSLVAGGASMLLMTVARGPVPIGLAWTGQFAAAGTMIVATATVRQRLIPDHLLGRVLGTARMIAFASIPLAALAAGLFEARARDAYAIMVFAGLSWAVIAVAVARSPLRRLTVEDVRAGTAAGSAPPSESPPPDRR